MKINNYFKNFLKNFFISSGFLMIITTIFSVIHSTETIKISLLFQIMLLASAYTFLKLAFVDEKELGKKVQTIAFYINLSISEIIILLWLLFFSPGKIVNTSLIMLYIFSIIIVKIFVYTMTRINGEKQAKLINEKLLKYKKEEN